MGRTKAAAILPGPEGKAIFGEVYLPAGKLNGPGEREDRENCALGKMHSADEGTATIITVVRGRWPIKLASGQERTFEVGETVVIQDGSLPNECGHQSGGEGNLVLMKVTVTCEFEVVGA